MQAWNFQVILFTIERWLLCCLCSSIQMLLLILFKEKFSFSKKTDLSFTRSFTYLPRFFFELTLEMRTDILGTSKSFERWNSSWKALFFAHFHSFRIKLWQNWLVAELYQNSYCIYCLLILFDVYQVDENITKFIVNKFQNFIFVCFNSEQREIFFCILTKPESMFM